MTKQEAIELLKSAPRTEKPSRVNPGLTQKCVAEIVEKCVEEQRDGKNIDEWLEKRVYQAARNQRRPRY